MISFGRHICNNFPVAIDKEWLLTNRKGSYASSTILFANTRKYHGLLVVNSKDTGERVVIFPNMDEEFEIAGNIYHFSTNIYRKTIYPKGYSYLESFHIDNDMITSVYLIDNIRLKKEIFLLKDENTVVINYSILTPQSYAKLHIRPFIAFREVNALMREILIFDPDTTVVDRKKIKMNPYKNLPAGYIYNPDNGELKLDEVWYRDFYYEKDESMGFEAWEDLFNPCMITLEMEYNDPKTIILSTEDKASADYASLKKRFDEQVQEVRAIYTRLEPKIKNKNHAQSIEELVFAANSFMAETAGYQCVAAGYPWSCSCWLRDTFLALPGLFLVTGRFEDAKKILEETLRLENNGLLPLRAGEKPAEVSYASADTTLLFFYALNKYLSYTNDFSIVKKDSEFFKKLTWIMHKHINGTEYNIHMDPADSLIISGYPGIPLTWMDAKISAGPVTPRHGKAVEINVFWYNALKTMEIIADKNGETAMRDSYGELGRKVYNNFNRIFWNDNMDCLYDFFDGTYFNEDIRLNQITALSFPFTLIDDQDKREKIMNTIVKELYTSFGLRTLTAMNVEFKAKYEGNQTARDVAEHQGTVWGWTVGSFVSAYLKTYGRTDETLRFIETVYEPFFEHMKNSGLGTISEMFDGGFPYKERGRLSHSWAVAEILRSYFEDYLGGDDKY